MTNDTELAAVESPPAELPERTELSALEIVHKMTAIYQQAMQILEQSQAAIMECMWEIKARHCGDSDAEFQCFAARYIDIVTPGEAVKLANTWAGARKNRELRELAQSKPGQAVKLVCQLTDGGALEVLEDDAEVARLLTLPPRKRSKAIREMIDAKQSVEAGHHPADRERIKALEAERDAALEALEAQDQVAHLSDAPKAQLAQYAEDCDRVLQQVRDFAAASDQHLAAADFSGLGDDVLLAHQERIAQFEREMTLLGESVRNQWLRHVREVI